MTGPEILLNPADAAQQLGVSVKALRLYEDRGLVRPQRNLAGWRFYGPAEMARCREVVALRALGLSLRDVGAVMAGERKHLDAVLAGHQVRLEAEMTALSARLLALQSLRSGLAAGRLPQDGDYAAALRPCDGLTVAMDLPWPWAGERFEIARLPALTFLTGPLGSGKTRLAAALAAHIAGAVFSGLNRMAAADTARQRIASEPEMQSAFDWLIADGATESDALAALVVALCDTAPTLVVVDYIEEGLDAATQVALGAWLRLHVRPNRPRIVMTRSSAVLDLEAATADHLVIYCPANHAPPIKVMPVPGAAGYEAVATCLAPPDVRERTAGMVAAMP